MGDRCRYRIEVSSALLATAVLALASGLIARAAGEPRWSVWVWTAGSAPVAVALIASILRRLARGDAGLDVIALVSIVGAMALGEHLTGVVVAVMVASGAALEDYAEARARRQMSELLGRAPRSANRYEPSGIVQIPAASVVPGDRLLVRTGEIVPVDGHVESALAVLDESALTGEPLPVERHAGEPAQSGSINSGAPFDLRATASASDSTFAGIVRLVEAAQKAKAPAARLADRYALAFIPLSLGVAAAAWLVSGDPTRALAVLVVATPCPLILAVPVAIVSGMSRCAARGILVKGGAVLERLADATILFLDKTGTLTRGRPELVSVQSDSAFDSTEILRAAASLEQASQHVVAEAVARAARARGLELSLPSSVEEEAGAGLSGIIDGRSVVAGSHAYVTTRVGDADRHRSLLQQMAYSGALGVFVAIDGKLAGVLLLRDEIRLDTPRAIRLLRRAGVARVVMLTGDHRLAAEGVAAAISVDEVLADQTPQGKLEAIDAARAGGVTIMVGDGVNDAPALAAADVGVAMGARGSGASSEAAGVVLLIDRLDRLADALHIARRSRAIALQSVAAGMGLSIAAMIAAAAGYLPPLAGAILQEAIDVAVILNALRALGGARHARAGMLEQGRVQRLAAEHEELLRVLDRVRDVAERLPTLPSSVARTELVALDGLLREELLPHERSDDLELYPMVARLLGGDDPLGAMSRTHREVVHLTRTLRSLIDALPPHGPDAAARIQLQRILYSLEAILRLHFAQEDEIYHALADAS